MPTSSLVKIHWYLLKLSSGNGQITLSKINEICPLTIPNQISTISMHTPSLVKIHLHLLKLSSEKQKYRQTDGRTTDRPFYETVFVRLSIDLSLIFSNPTVQIFNPTMAILTPQWQNKCNEPLNVKFYSNPNTRMSHGHVRTDGQTHGQPHNTIIPNHYCVAGYKNNQTPLLLEMDLSKEFLFVCVEILQPNQPMGSCRARSVYLTTLLLVRLSPLSS